MMKKILVVGATGIMGSHLVKEFSAQGKDIYALIRAETLHNPERVDPLKALGIHLVEGDLQDAQSLRKACQGMDAVVSAAGGAQIALQNDLINAAKEAGVKRFIPSEYGVDPYVVKRGDVPVLANYKQKMINDKLLIEAVPCGQFYKTPAAGKYIFFFAKGVKNLSEGRKLHLSFIYN